MTQNKPNRPTKIIWEKDPDDLEGKYLTYIGKYPYLKEEKYSHKREQLYLMLQYGMSDVFIDSFYRGDENITSRDLDFIRLAAMLFGEAFVTEHFYKKEYGLEQAKEFMAGKVIQNRCAGLPKLEELLQEHKWMKERFELQCEFLEKERERSEQHLQELLAKEKEICEERCSSERLKLELKNGELEEKLYAAEKEKDRWETEKNRLLEQCCELKAKLEQDLQENGKAKDSFLAQFCTRKEQQKREKEQKERNRFMMMVISDPEFSKEQLEYILQAAQAELTLLELRQLCNPKLDVRKMELLKQFYMKQRERRNVLL